MRKKSSFFFNTMNREKKERKKTKEREGLYHTNNFQRILFLNRRNKSKKRGRTRLKVVMGEE